MNLGVVANNHFIWNEEEWIGGLRKGKLIAGGYWVFGGSRLFNKFQPQRLNVEQPDQCVSSDVWGSSRFPYQSESTEGPEGLGVSKEGLSGPQDSVGGVGR